MIRRVTKTIIFETFEYNDLTDIINGYINEFKDDNRELIDIKYTMSYTDHCHFYSAMIIYIESVRE